MAEEMEIDGQLRFHEIHSAWVLLEKDRLTAAKYWGLHQHAPVFSEEPMETNRLYEVSIERLNALNETTYFGIVIDPQLTHHRENELKLMHPKVLCIAGNGVWTFGTWVRDPREFLKFMPEKSRVGLALDEDRSLHVYLNGVDKGVVTRNIPDHCYLMFDLYARCQEIIALPIRVL